MVVEGAEGEVVEVVAVESSGETVERRPAADATPWLSLPQCQGQRRGGQAVFHERPETP